MHIRKQRLLTPGPTPLLPAALHAMMGSDIHHRTEDFRNLYKQVLSDLVPRAGNHERCPGSSSLRFRWFGSGHPKLLLSPATKRLVCSAGKFGERWVEIMKAWGMKATVLTAPYGDAVPASAVEEALAKNPNIKGVFVQASETSTGTIHDVKGHGSGSQEDQMRFSSWMPLPASAPCRLMSKAGGSILSLAVRKKRS